MKIKNLLLTLLLGFAFGLFSFQGQAATKLFKMGTNPLYKAKNLQAEQVYSIVKKMEKDVKTGFYQAGADDVFTRFMDQLELAKLEAVEIQPGETLQWMLYKKNKKVRVLKNPIWAGKKPFKAYHFVLEHYNRNYEFIFPVVSLNISLKGVSDVPQKIAPPPTPPIAGKPKEAPVATPSTPLKTEESKIVPAPATPAPKAVEEPRKGFVVLDVGPLFRTDPSIFGLFRGGFMYEFTEKIALTGLLGYAALLKNDIDHPAFLADVIFSFYPAKGFFIGAGAGLWATSKETNVDTILETGFHLTDFSDQPNIAVFLEARSAFDKTKESLPSERIGVGLRMLF